MIIVDRDALKAVADAIKACAATATDSAHLKIVLRVSDEAAMKSALAAVLTSVDAPATAVIPSGMYFYVKPGEGDYENCFPMRKKKAEAA